jgi:7-carboxy-7-deazaguanine synthase
LSSNGDRGWRGAARPGPGELLVSEVFGPTLQGEGPSAGRTAAFVRLGGCHLACSWCDTAYTWDSGRHDLAVELAVRATADVVADALAVPARLVVLTGGEPALQSQEAASLARQLRAAGRRVELETSGSVPLGALAAETDLIVVSPKLSSSGMVERRRLPPEPLRALAGTAHAVFKLVLTGPEDLAEADALITALGVAADRVWAMPEGTDAAVVTSRMRLLAGPVADRGWSLSGRLQVLLWDGARGR